MSRQGIITVITFLVWSTATPIGLIVARPPLTGPVSVEVDEPVDPATVARGPGSDDYFTGFEPEEGFIARDPNFPTSGFSGWINGQPWNPVPQLNWATGTTNCNSQIEGHVNQLNPYLGNQHLRLSHDPVARACCWHCYLAVLVSARIPANANVIAQPVAPYRVECQMAISELGGQDFRIQPQSNTQGFLSTSVLFWYTGGIYVLDDVCGTYTLQFKPTGFFWDTTGAYQSMSIEMDPCANTVDYRYGGHLIYSSCVYGGTALEQFLVFGDNYPGSHLDLDNVGLTRGEPCQFECGNNVIEPVAGEECDGTDDAACPGHCQADCLCGPPVGACCDTNGPDFGCVEDQPEEACSDSDEVWNLFTPCANVQCECIPQCGDRRCGGDNGCGGNCGECGDETVCNGIEFCDEETGQCRPGTPLVCSDGDACNGIEVCNHVVQGCLPGTPPICDDGLFCNGLEYCQSPFGCAPGQPPCSAAEYCDESTDECSQPIIPAASVWGLTVLALALLIGGKIHFGRKNNSTA